MVAISAGSSVEPLLCVWRSWRSWRSHTVLLCIDTLNELVCISSGDAIIVAERYRRRPIRKKGGSWCSVRGPVGPSSPRRIILASLVRNHRRITSYGATVGLEEFMTVSYGNVGTREREGPEIWRSGKSNYM